MYSIPQIALKIGAESLNNFPVSYSKSRISGSDNTTYILHSKGGCMPGQPELFRINSTSDPSSFENINENQVIRAFRLENAKKSHKSIGNKYIGNYLNCYTYDQYCPNDDETLTIAINACYKQIYGNFHPMESERPIELERRLRNGDLSIREFIRQLAKSPFYLHHYLEKITQQRAIELSIKHLLGRPPRNQKEIIKYIQFIDEQGFNNHIDGIIDSKEYVNIFGEDVVPYMRCWNSACGLQTSDFMHSSELTKSFTTSDNALHKKDISGKLINGRSLLLKECLDVVY